MHPPEVKTLVVGEKLTLSVAPDLTGRGDAPAASDCIWRSSNPGVARIPSAEGGGYGNHHGQRVTVEAKNVGMTHVSAHCRGFEAAIVVRVIAADSPLSGLTLTAE